jgi:hypothetical protein
MTEPKWETVISDTQSIVERLPVKGGHIYAVARMILIPGRAQPLDGVVTGVAFVPDVTL